MAADPTGPRLRAMKVVGVLLVVGGVGAAFSCAFLHGYVRAMVFVLGGTMIVYGTLLATATPPSSH